MAEEPKAPEQQRQQGKADGASAAPSKEGAAGEPSPTASGEKPATGEQASSWTALQSELEAERKQRKELEKKVSEYEKAQLSEKERLEREADDAKKRVELLQGTVVSLAIEATARDLGFRSPHLGSRLIDRSKIELDDEGRPTNVKALLEQVLKDAPELKGAAGTPTRNTNPPGSADAPQVAREEYIKKTYGNVFRNRIARN